MARPAPAGTIDQVLPVDWKGITRRGHTRSNYQLLPGDRVFVMSQPIAKFDSYLARYIAPIERMMGTTLLGTGMVNSLSGQGAFNGNNNGIIR